MQTADSLAVFVEHVAVDDGVFDAARRHYEPTSAAGEIVAHLATSVGADGVVIEDGDVGSETRHQAATVFDAKESRRLRGDALNRLGHFICMAFRFDHARTSDKKEFAAAGRDRMRSTADIK